MTDMGFNAGQYVGETTLEHERRIRSLAPDLRRAGVNLAAHPQASAADARSSDDEFARALRARRAEGKAEEKLRLADSLEWLHTKDNGTVILFTKTFTDHFLTFVAIRYNDMWYSSFSKAHPPMDTTDLIIFMLKGEPVQEVVEMTTADRHLVTDVKVIEAEK